MLKCFSQTTRTANNMLRYYAKDIRFGAEARSLLLQGVDVMANAVATTMGPKGRNALIEQLLQSPKITKDGITVADAVLKLQDNMQNIGAKLVRDVANNTNNEAGDGTTTATILARAIAKGGYELITKGANPMEIRQGILLAAEKVSEHLKKMSRAVLSVDQIAQVAHISTNGDMRIAKLIRNAMLKLGPDGVFLVKDGKSMHDEVEVIRGIQFDEGYISPFFVNSVKDSKVEFSNALLLLTLAKIKELSSILPALELSLRLQRPLVIVADSIEGEALSALIVNRLKLDLKVCAVKAPSFGDYRRDIMADIAVATGATVFDDTISIADLEKIQKEHLGRIRDVVITKKRTLFLKGGGLQEQIDARAQLIREQLKELNTDTEAERLRERLARLVAGVALLHVGGTSELEIEEKKDRVNDALNAIRATIREGIVPGGGTAFLRCIPVLEELKATNSEQQLGIDIVCNALRLPCMNIAQNAGMNGSEIVSQVLCMRDNWGYDAKQDKYCDLIENGIIDPTAVARSAIKDAAGIASMLITAEVVITEAPKKPPTLNKKNKIMQDIAKLLGM